MSQIWIKSEGGYLDARVLSSKKKSKTGYLLVPGLFEPCCDLYYFVQEFIEELKETDSFGLVFEFSGNGDSFGDISSMTVSSMKQNIKDVLEYIRSQGVREIIAVGRGIGANLLNSAADDESVKAVYMINPMVMGSNALQILENFIGDYDNEEVYLAESVLKQLQAILYTAGVDMSNIQEERISLHLLKEMLNTDDISNKDNLHSKSNVLITNDVQDKYVDPVTDYLIDADLSKYNDRYSVIKEIIAEI